MSIRTGTWATVMTVALSLAGNPALAQQAVAPAPAGGPARSRRSGRAGPTAGVLPGRARKAAQADRAVSGRIARPDAACGRLSARHRPGVAMAGQEQGRGRQEGLHNRRRAGLGSRSQGDGAFPGSDPQAERRPRLDERPRGRLRLPARGRRRRHPDASQPGREDRGARHDPAAEGGEADGSRARGDHHRALGSRSHLRSPVRSRHRL